MPSHELTYSTEPALPASKSEPSSRAQPRPARTDGRLERVLRSGRFAVTAELNPPDSADPEDVYRNALVLSQVCDAINATDGSGANCHMSSLGCCALLTRAGYEPVFQIGCRDRNRIAIQGDILGAAALGVHNVLCLTGDDVSAGDQPQAKRVFDFDSIQLLRTARIIRDMGVFLSGRQITTRAAAVSGRGGQPLCAALRLAPPAPGQEDRGRRRFHPDAILLRRAAHAAVHATGARYGPARDAPTFWSASARCARHARPSLSVTRCRACTSPMRWWSVWPRRPRKQQTEEGKRICIEIIEQMQEIEGIHGVHLMAYRQEETVSEIVERAKLFPRRPIAAYAVAEPAAESSASQA